MDKNYNFSNNILDIIANPGKYEAEWSILQEASRRDPNNDIYATAIKQKFIPINSQLPTGMQGLQLLNNIGEFDKVIKYYEKIQNYQEQQHT